LRPFWTPQGLVTIVHLPPFASDEEILSHANWRHAMISDK
jgi:hypothetical protein